ncbi:hypothetical protein ACPTFZ_14240, partial [Enterococcus faecalis]
FFLKFILKIGRLIKKIKKKSEKKRGKEEMKEMFDVVIYGFNQQPTAERQERYEKKMTHTQTYRFQIHDQ